jgi:DNA-binding IclR family transcriptional regulator
LPPSSKQTKPHGTSLAVERAVDLLFLIARSGEVSLTELARSIGSSGSAVHRIMTALKKKGLVEQAVENGPYSLSWSILELSTKLLTDSDLRATALPFMRRLRDETQETVTLNVRSGFQRVCVEQLGSAHEVRWWQEVGSVSPLYAGPTGKVILAYFSEEELDDYLRTVPLEQLTPYTTVDVGEFRAELTQIRAAGYAVGNQDRVLGVSGISAPVFDAAGHASATLAVAGPAERCSEGRLESWAPLLVESCAQISHVARLLAAAGAADE